METGTDEAARVLPFQLQFDKPIAAQIKIAEWNPEKDLLAMVTEDSKLLLHRFNWQRLWSISPGKGITSLCWRPDGKAIAVGLEDGTISLHDVENGKMLRSLMTHSSSVVSLNWEEDRETTTADNVNISTYNDRTLRFFPPPPRCPRMPGFVPGDNGFMDDSEDSFEELSNSSNQKFNILCSGDKDGSICFSVFGIFPIGKVDIHTLSVRHKLASDVSLQLLSASINKVSLSRGLCRLIVMCNGELTGAGLEASDYTSGCKFNGLHCIVLDTSIFWKRKNELHQVAQQASKIADLIEVIRASIAVMSRQWSDAMRAFLDKFDSLNTLISDHGLDSSPQEEFLSLLGGARTSPPVHQFLVNSLGEAGLKRVAKVVSGAGKELQLVVLDHLKPAAEIIGFRMGELRGLSKWHSRFQGIGLDEKLLDDAMENAGIFLVQVERFMRVLSSVVQQFSNFFNWLLKSMKILMSEPSDQLPPFSSELAVIFLKFLYDQDPVKQLLDSSDVDCNIDVDFETEKRIKELAHFGGFLDFDYLKRTLAAAFGRMESSFKEAFQMPFNTISGKILCEDMLPLFPTQFPPNSGSSNFSVSISYYTEDSSDISNCGASQQKITYYMSFKIPESSLQHMENCFCIVKGDVHEFSGAGKSDTSTEAALLSVPDGYHCVDLSLYKERQIVLLLNESTTTSESLGHAHMMILQASYLPFQSLPRSTNLSSWKLQELKDSIIHLLLENEKVRAIPHSAVPPLAVSASRGVACVFAAKKRALVYILDEDEDEISDGE